MKDEATKQNQGKTVCLSIEMKMKMMTGLKVKSFLFNLCLSLLHQRPIQHSFPVLSRSITFHLLLAPSISF